MSPPTTLQPAVIRPLSALLLWLGCATSFNIGKPGEFLPVPRPLSNKVNVQHFASSMLSSVINNLQQHQLPEVDQVDQHATSSENIWTHICATPPSAVEAQVLNDIPKALDLASHCGCNCLPAKVTSLIGHLCSMGADSITDHSILSQDFGFQSVMLAFALPGLARSCVPIVRAAFSNPLTVRDVKAFKLLFQPAGMSCQKFKALSASDVIEWVTLKENDTILSDGENAEKDYAYWLYRGNVVTKRDSTIIRSTTRSSGGREMRRGVGMGLLGETRLMRCLAQSRGKDTSTWKYSEILQHSELKIEAGPEGATMLRIDLSRLSSMLNGDDEMAQSLQNLVIQGMHEKLSAQLEPWTARKKECFA